MTGFFSGAATAMITPFNDGGVNFTVLGEMLERQIECGIDALVLLGTTGEPSTMSGAEKDLTIRYAVKKATGRIKIIVGAGSNDTSKAIAAAARAESLGADGIMAVTPYYNKCTQRGLCAYYESICAAVRLPVIAYNVPSRTGVNLTPDTAEKIAAIPNLAGIKEASGNMAQACETMRRIRGKCDLYSGEDALNVPVLAIGGAGVISVVSNVAPKQVKEICSYARAGDFVKANAVQERLLPLIDACFAEVNPIPVKAACNLLGYDAGIPRPPLTELEPRHKAAILKHLKRLGLI